MKVLWFTNTPSLYKKDLLGYHGGGWIESLEASIGSFEDIQLGISFFHNDTDFKVTRDKTTYYPIPVYNKTSNRIKRIFFPNRAERFELDAYLKVIADYKPDIIHIFGTEQSFGLLNSHVDIPIVIHMQGLLNPYLNSFFPPNSTLGDHFRFLSFFKALRVLKSHFTFKHSAARERTIMMSGKHFLGRTAWDKNVLALYSPNASYTYCGEILREPFYKASPWLKRRNQKVQIISTISEVSYKGFDVVLKTANLLNSFTELEFEWKVFGIDHFDYWERKMNITSSSVCVSLMGVSTAEDLVNAMHSADVFVHPSYIDNSPNSVCEAQMIGVPVVSTNVGGLSSLINDGVDGILVPANDPFSLAAAIKRIVSDELLAKALGAQARTTAMERHSKERIVAQNTAVYNVLNGK